jgi:hypothetical protein
VGEQELRELLEGLDIRNRGVIEYDEFLAGAGCPQEQAQVQAQRPVKCMDVPAGKGAGMWL